MAAFDLSSPFFNTPSLSDEERGTSLYQEIREAMQLLGLDANLHDAECYEALQVHWILFMESSSSSSSSSPSPSSSSSPCPFPSMNQSDAASISLMPLLSSTNSVLQASPLSASESSIPSPLQHHSIFFLDEASNSPPTSTPSSLPTSSVCNLCTEKVFPMGFFEQAFPCGHLFCYSCLFFLEKEKSSSSEGISCIVDGCKGYLASMKTKKSTKELVCCPFCHSLQLPKKELLESNMIVSAPNATETYYGARCQCCYCSKLF